MKAVLFDEPGDPDVLYVGKCPKPVPGEEELLVRVAATALNRADTMQRRGRYDPPPGASPILGLEVAGVVASVGSACSGWQVGDTVMGLLTGGGYAEFAVLHHQHAMPVPGDLSLVSAAAIPEVFLTAFQALFLIGRLTRDEDVLFHAGASGVGTAAIQLAKVAGARIFVTASPQKHAACYELGADLAIDYRTEEFAKRIEDSTDGRGVDLIVDCVGAVYFHRNVRSLALDGRLVLISMLGGSRVAQVDLRRLFKKRVQVTATTLRSRSVAYKAALVERFAAESLPLFADGRLHEVVDSVVDIEDVQDAHRRMEANENVGKIVLKVGG